MSACTICSVFAVSLTLLLTLLSLSLSRSPSNFFSSLRLILSSFQLTVLILQSEANLRPELHFTLFSRSAQPSLCSSLSLFLSSPSLFSQTICLECVFRHSRELPKFSANFCNCLPQIRLSACLSSCLSVRLSVRLPPICRTVCSLAYPSVHCSVHSYV